MANVPSIDDIWKEYYDEVVMNSVVHDDDVEGAVPIDDSGEFAIRTIFNNSIKLLIEDEKVIWDPSPGVRGIARRFILSTAAGVGRYASAFAAKHNKDIDKETVEGTFDKLVHDWERVCPLPIVPPRVSCPTEKAIKISRATPFIQGAPAGA